MLYYHFAGGGCSGMWGWCFNAMPFSMLRFWRFLLISMGRATLLPRRRGRPPRRRRLVPEAAVAIKLEIWPPATLLVRRSLQSIFFRREIKNQLMARLVSFALFSFNTSVMLFDVIGSLMIRYK
ncbi:unnamed protein product [Linum tenue]|uniref:Uncharacterized protein n=1 Tax=Linum tenue TaxID=586396 RepID=A0AAV0JIU9_9ROSI|nr:unnamed protein product [Linum tenue]